MALVLTVTSYHRLSPDLTVERTIGDGPFTIGRDPACDWALVDTEKLMSKRHVTLARVGQGYQATDNSLNGTFLNDEIKPIGRGLSRPIQDGDRLRLSDYEIAVAIAPDDGPAKHPTAWDDDVAPAAYTAPGEPSAGMESPVAGPAAPGWAAPDLAAAPSAPMGSGGGAPLPPNAALLDDDPADAPEPGEMPAWSTESERVALRPMRPVIPDNWHEEPEDAAPLDAPVANDPPAQPANGPIAAEVDAPGARVLDDGAPSAPLGPAHAPPSEAGAGSAMPPSPPPPFAEPSASRQPSGAAPAPPAGRTTGGDARDGIAAFLRGAGLPPDAVSGAESDAALEEAGRLFATMVAGLTDVLATRSEVRNEFRLQQTVIRPRENNPLKFSATTEDALRALLSGRRQGYMPPQQAVEEAVDDVKAHQIAVMAGVQGAVKGLLNRFDPNSLQQRFGADRNVLGLGGGKGRAWDAFVRLYADIAAEAEDDFHAVLGREFAKAYEACGRDRGRGQ